MTMATDPRIDSPRRRLHDLFESLGGFNLEGDIYNQESTNFGFGGSSDVFRAFSRKHSRLVAVKSIRMFLLEDESSAKALEREMRLWIRLDHQNVLPLLGFFLNGPNAIPNFVSEWMKNGTVTKYMKERPFNAVEMCSMIAGIASGLKYLHVEQNIVHSDVKGSNILVSDDGKPLLADFGLSISSASLSLAGTSLHGGKGSLRWMAKELHFFDSHLDHSMMTDMWSFGMVICELLTKYKPYPGVPDCLISKTILEGHLPQRPDFSSLHDCEVYHSLWNLARSCWDDVPTQRVSAAVSLESVNKLLVSLRGGTSTSTSFNVMQHRTYGAATAAPMLGEGVGATKPLRVMTGACRGTCNTTQHQVPGSPSFAVPTLGGKLDVTTPVTVEWIYGEPSTPGPYNTMRHQISESSIFMASTPNLSYGSPIAASDVPQKMRINASSEAEYQPDISYLHFCSDAELRKRIRSERRRLAACKVGVGLTLPFGGISLMGVVGRRLAKSVPNQESKLKLLETEWARRGYAPV